MPDYKLGKIYKIISDLSDEIYIGSTTAPRLCTRMVGHRAYYNRWLNDKSNYMTAHKLFFDNGVETCRIILLEYWPCSSKEELEARENYWIQKTPNCVNKLFKVNVKENKQRYFRKYHKKHINEIHKRQKEYRIRKKVLKQKLNKE